MSVNLGAALSAQMFGNTFEAVSKELGADLVAAIPVQEYPKGLYESDYPMPWYNPCDLKADVVKGVLPLSQRPFIAVRYVQEKTNTLAIEFFVQRYEGNISKHWTSTEHGTAKAIWKLNEPWMPVLRALLSGESLEKTQGRFLPVFAAHYKKPVVLLSDYKLDTMSAINAVQEQNNKLQLAKPQSAATATATG